MILHELKVIEFAGSIPGSFCGMVLAEFGANVIRIDKVRKRNRFDVLSNGKKSIALNLNDKRSIEIVKRLIKETDVLIEQFRPGMMERFGLGPDDLMLINDRLIYVRINGYGQTGYYSPRAGHNLNFFSLTGLLALFGRHNQKPTFPPYYPGNDIVSVVGILLALIERTKSGKGQIVDANAIEGIAYSNTWLYKTQRLPLMWDNKRGENILDGGSHFYDVYETKDNEYVAVCAVEKRIYGNLLNRLGLTGSDAPQLIGSEANRELFTKLFRTKTRDEWCEHFDGTDVCVTPVLSIVEAYERNRGSFVKIDDCVFPKPAPRLSRTPGKSLGHRGRPMVGQDTRDILEKLQYKDEEIERFVKDGVVECFKPSSKL